MLIFIFFLVEKFLSSFPNQNLDLDFDMLEDNLIVCGQNIINHFSEIFMESELKKINKGRVKINLYQVGVKNFKTTIQNHIIVVSCKLFIFRY